jgi:hypothetical protein
MTLLAKHRDLEIHQGCNGLYIYHTDGRCSGMGSEPMTRKFARQLLLSDYEYNETMAAYFPDIDRQEASE